jgi:SAM-dependent methyltransferase
MTRTEIIQSLIDLHGYKSYLEIGVQNGVNFNAIKCKSKVGVDPDRKSKATIFLPSDLFFTLNSETFDIIFIDGLHEADQVMRDLENAYVCLNKGGVIVVHDCNPEKEIHQRVPRESKVWNGDVWKAFIRFRSDDDFVIDTDCGVGIIMQGGGVHSVGLFDGMELNWTNFVQNRKQWLNLISVDEFKTNFLNEQHRIPA